MKNLILIFTIIFISNNLFAQRDISVKTGEQNKKRFALVIGNADYLHGGKLKNPVNDADLIAKTLKEMNFTVIKKINLTLREMQVISTNFKQKIKNYEVALFFYAGHGIQINGKNYLIPVDAKLDNREMAKYDVFDVSDINDAFLINGKNINIMILDACRNDPFSSWERGGERGFKKVENPTKGTIIGFATQPGETAADGSGKNGLYTKNLVKQMKIPQDIEKVFKNTRIAVDKVSKGKQIPQEWSSLMGDFYFVKNGKKVVNNPEESTWDEEKIYTYGNIKIYTEISGDFYLDNKKIGYLYANSGKTRNKVLTGEHTYKIVGNNETKTGIVTVYKNQTSDINIKKKIIDFPEQFTDKRDGQIYRTVEIGGQIWMAENLAYRTQSGCRAYNNNMNNVEKYGYLYNYKTAENICPDGWRLPEKLDFELLLANAVNTEKSLFDIETDTEIVLNVIENLLDQVGGEAAYNSLVENGKSGFDVLFGGSRYFDDNFVGLEDFANFWSATKSMYGAKYCNFDKNIYDANIYDSNIEAGFSVRCILDN